MIPIDLSGKVAVVTGGVQGLGRATAAMLLQAGARVAVNYYDDPEGVSRQRADEVSREWGTAGLVKPADVRSREQMTEFLQTVRKKFGRLDMLINNAAILRDRTMAL